MLTDLSDLRTYQAGWLIRRTRRTIYAFCIFCIVALPLVVLAEGSGFPWAVTAGLVIFDGLIILWFEKITTRSGLEERIDGYAYHHNFGTTLVPLSNVARFEAGRLPFRRGTPGVILVHPGGGYLQVQGLIQGKNVGWEGGDTNDIVGLLNERHTARVQALGSPSDLDGPADVR